MNPPDNDPGYRLTLVDDVPSAIRRLAKEAASVGKRQAYLDALQTIEARLATNPLQFGECRYRLLMGQLSCQIGAIKRVAVQFAVHEERREVFVLKVFLLGS